MTEEKPEATPAYSSVACYGALCEAAAAIQQLAGTVEVQAAVLVLGEVTFSALRDSTPAHLDAVLGEAGEVVRRLAAAEVATGEA